jgi:periplasmic divalent cation tolerance protein
MGETSSELIVVFMTAGNVEEATRLADMLVGSKLAACVQILPEMESIYRWKGKVERAGEVLLVVKTLRAKFPQLEAAVRSIHSYETPEIIALPIVDGSKDYLDWLSQSVE